jgi:phospholipase/lecithinase/hemolysin
LDSFSDRRILAVGPRINNRRNICVRRQSLGRRKRLCCKRRRDPWCSLCQRPVQQWTGLGSRPRIRTRPRASFGKLGGGTDYAYGGAETGTTPVHTANASDLTGATGQVAQFQAAHSSADPNALYTIWIGSNDLLDILTGAPPSQYATDITAAVDNIDSAIGSLAADGAKNFLILTVPDLGVTPDAIAGGSGVQFAASALAAEFDSALISSLDAIASLDSLNLSTLDTYSLLDAIVANPSSYGFTNVTSPCVTGAIDYVGGTACASTLAAQNKYLFWDDLHPTEAGHAIVADAALAVVTPEPAYAFLVTVGLMGMALVLRRADIRGTSRYSSYVSKISE